MIINSIFSANYHNEMDIAELILKLQLFINIDKSKDFQKKEPIPNILNYCMDICQHVTMFGNTIAYKGSYDKEMFKITSLISVYNTVCELLYRKHDTLGFTNAASIFNNNNINSMYNANKNFKKNTSCYIHRALFEHINSGVATKKKIMFYAFESTILLFNNYLDFNLNVFKKKIREAIRWDKLESNISNYLKITNKVFSKFNIYENKNNLYRLKEYKEQSSLKEYSSYINNIYEFETITNKYLYEDILKCALYLLYYDYDLNDYIINTLVKFIDMPSVYSKNQLLFFFLSRLNSNFKSFEYFNTLNNADIGMKFEFNEYRSKEAIYSQWINSLESVRKIFAGTIIPVFENTLFILLYKHFKTNNDIRLSKFVADYTDTPDAVLIKMKTEIEKYLISHTDTILRNCKFDIYKKGDNLMVSNLKPIDKSEAISLKDLFDMVKKKGEPSQKESLKKLVYKFFDYMDNHPRKQRYNLSEKTFDLRNAILSEREQQILIDPIIANLVKGRCHIISKTDI